MTGLIIGSVVCLMALALWLYRRATLPFRTFRRGVELLSEQDFASRLLHVGQPNVDAAVDMFNQMMDALRSERLQLFEQNAFLNLLIRELPVGVIIYSANGEIAEQNNAASAFLGQDGSLPAGECEALAMGESKVVRSPSGDIFRISKQGFMDCGWKRPFVIIELLTEEMRKAERNAYKRVISTISHEVNNSMGAIQSTLSTIYASSESSHSEALRACLERSAQMTDFVRAYAEVVRVPRPQLVLSDYMELVSSSLPLLNSLCSRYGAVLDVDLENAAPIHFDPMLMQQVIVNVVKNAAESAGHAGNVIIRADGKTLTITDDGPGLSAEVSSRLFNEVYSSKSDGRGLGLMLVAEILRRHSARFSLVTADALTTFTISL